MKQLACKAYKRSLHLGAKKWSRASNALELELVDDSCGGDRCISISEWLGMISTLRLMQDLLKTIGRRGRVQFTEEDDLHLVEYLSNSVGGRKGNRLWQELVNQVRKNRFA